MHRDCCLVTFHGEEKRDNNCGWIWWFRLKFKFLNVNFLLFIYVGLNFITIGIGPKHWIFFSALHVIITFPPSFNLKSQFSFFVFYLKSHFTPNQRDQLNGMTNSNWSNTSSHCTLTNERLWIHMLYLTNERL